MSFEAFHVTAPEPTTEDCLASGFSGGGTHLDGDVFPGGGSTTTDE